MITHDDLVKIAALAKLSLEGEDIEALAADVGGIIEFANAIAAADVPEIARAGECANPFPLREDNPEQSAAQDDILRNAAASRDGYFVAGRTGGAAR
jgi:aspartyl-tRNA(Asn)/glutamyl-tRNA(Gln) amidotransferase subunit C